MTFRAFILIFLFLTSTAEAQQYWISQASPTSHNLRACFFTDSTSGWIAGDSGVMLHTSDAGKSWTFQNTNINDGIISLFFLNKNRGYGLAWEIDNTPPNYYGTRMLTTTDGGQSWNNFLYPDSNLFLNSIYFLDSLNGYMVGSGGSLMFTSNAGTSWNYGVIDSGMVLGFPVEEIKFFDSQNGFAVGGAFDIAGVIWKTTNGGRSWQTRIVGPEPLNDLHIFDPMNTIAVGGDFEYGSSKVVTHDAGGSWLYNELGVFGIANSIAFRKEREGWISLGIVDSFLMTTNSGANWRLVPSAGGSRIFNIVFPDSLHGWAVGNAGAILKFNVSAVGISETLNNIPEEYLVLNNYPNPFNPNTQINFQFKDRSHVRLSVFDIEGKEIEVLTDKILNGGSYVATFEGNNLSSGIYFCRLEMKDMNSGKHSHAVRKMILVR